MHRQVARLCRVQRRRWEMSVKATQRRGPAVHSGGRSEGGRDGVRVEEGWRGPRGGGGVTGLPITCRHSESLSAAVD